MTLPANEAIAITVEYQANGYTPVDSFVTVQWSDEVWSRYRYILNLQETKTETGMMPQKWEEDCDDQNPTIYPRLRKPAIC